MHTIYDIRYSSKYYLFYSFLSIYLNNPGCLINVLRKHTYRVRVRTGQIGTAAFRVNLSAPTENFSHFFETSVGSGHMSLTLREDWRQHLRMAARDLGVKHIRGHGS